MDVPIITINGIELPSHQAVFIARLVKQALADFEAVGDTGFDARTCRHHLGEIVRIMEPPEISGGATTAA